MLENNKINQQYEFIETSMTNLEYFNNTNWFYKIYLKIIDKGLKRGLDKTKLNYITEKHHILPKCMGGKDEDDNYVLLTCKEHYIAHRILHRLYPENLGLMYAVNIMANIIEIKCPGYKVSSSLFEELREKFILSRKDTHFNQEWCNNISKSKKGIPLGHPDEDHIENIRKSKRGKVSRSRVIDPYGNVFSTMKACGEFHGVSAGIIKYWIIKRPDKGFKYYEGPLFENEINSGKRVIGPDNTVYRSVQDKQDMIDTLLLNGLRINLKRDLDLYNKFVFNDYM